MQATPAGRVDDGGGRPSDNVAATRVRENGLKE